MNDHSKPHYCHSSLLLLDVAISAWRDEVSIHQRSARTTGEWRASRDTIRGEYVGNTWRLIRSIRDGETRVRPIVAVCGDAGKKNHVSRGSKCHVISRNPLQHELLYMSTSLIMTGWSRRREQQGSQRGISGGQIPGIGRNETMERSWREPT